MNTTMKVAHTPGPWAWHDTFGRKNGEGEPIGVGRCSYTGKEPDVGSCTRFSFAVSDKDGFCVAHCTNALVTMSSDRSEANARLMAAAPELLAACEAILRCEPMQQGERNGAIMGMISSAIDAAREAIAKATS